MIDIDTFRKLALSFENATEEPHFDKTSFRIKKKIFATLNIQKNIATVKFTEIDQSVFCSFDVNVIYPVPNKWGKQGWTHINLINIRYETLADALTTSYHTVLGKRI